MTKINSPNQSNKFNFYRKSIKDIKDLFELAVRYEDGIGVKQDYSKAADIYQGILKENNDSDSAYNLARLYETGDGVEQDFSVAFNLYNQGVKNGDTDSMVNLALLYKKGLGVNHDCDKCFELLCIASGYKKLETHHNQFKKVGARCLCEGKVGKITHTQYSDKCWNYVKLCYDDGTTNKIHYTKGFLRYTSLPGSISQTEDVWVETDSESNRNAMYHLGSLFHFGNGVTQNIDTAIYFYKKAATNIHTNSIWPGDPVFGCKFAQFNLGIIYRKGFDHIKPDSMEALKWYTMSAEQGYERAQVNLAAMYDKGLGVRQSYNKAFRWYMKAALQGNPKAQFNVGCMYDGGDGVKQSNENAYIWYKRSAEQGHTDALVNLGIMYQNGQGVPIDYEKAINYFMDAFQKGDITSRDCILDLWKNTTNVPSIENSNNQHLTNHNSIEINDNYFSKK